jgi:hypothetical protein
VARIEGDAGVHTLSEECMEPKRLYGAAAEHVTVTEVINRIIRHYYAGG